MMKRAISLVALVAAPAALAASQPKTVTIDALPTVITYGNPTTLQGNVTPAQSAEVKVTATPCLNPPARAANSGPTTAKSDSTGAWSTIVAPRVRTSYQATAKSAQSETAMVQVRPRVTLVRVHRHLFRTRVTAAKSFAGKTVYFQKRTAFGWRTVKRVLLRTVSTSTDSVVSGKTFRSRVAAHRTVRVLVTQAVVGNCYLPGISNTVRS